MSMSMSMDSKICGRNVSFDILDEYHTSDVTLMKSLFDALDDVLIILCKLIMTFGYKQIETFTLTAHNHDEESQKELIIVSVQFAL